ncbi:hypothetical protein [Methylobacter marinus]|uniref:hypothetical protein n=1 Tax=Methylobacter marinus TaxID=34058 RepID=UPI00035EEB22|nr:hypothetical protein [Methylobacter marinus]
MPPRKNTKIPADNHIIRYIPWTKLRKNENGEVIGIISEAFKIRDTEKYLSATWLEYFQRPLRKDQIIAAVEEMRASNLAVKPKSGFSLGKVSDIESVCTKRNIKNIRIVYSPSDNNAAHVAVKSLPGDDLELLELLATEAWAELILNSSIP